MSESGSDGVRRERLTGAGERSQAAFSSGTGDVGDSTARARSDFIQRR
jgi:hypothetical protein